MQNEDLSHSNIGEFNILEAYKKHSQIFGGVKIHMGMTITTLPNSGNGFYIPKGEKT